MNPERYVRQTILDAFGPEAQEKLHRAKILVVGAGGLGVPVLTYLNAMGVGTLGIVDNDVVSVSNLHRQVLYSESDVGRSKVSAAAQKLKAQNSDTVLQAHNTFLTVDNALQLIGNYDVVVDASDNFPTRYLVNDACIILNKPFIYGALHAFEGQVSVFNHQNGPTYRCLFPEMPKADEIPNCDENGVLGIIPGIIGNLQALEAVKTVTGVGDTLSGKLLLFDGLSNSFQKIQFSVKPENLRIRTLKSNYEFDCGVDFASIDAEAFLQLMESDTIQLIDVRTPKEFNGNHLKGALNIPLALLEEQWSDITFDKKVYVVCQSGVRSKKAIAQLQNFRPGVAYVNVSGGMNLIRKHVVKY